MTGEILQCPATVSTMISTYNSIFLKQDSVENNFFYYNLAIKSPQQIRCDIYSARVKAVDNGEEPHAQISRYFKKVVAEHQINNKLDQFFSYTGDGSYSNSLTAWTPETFTIREQMPGVFDKEDGPVSSVIISAIIPRTMSLIC